MTYLKYDPGAASLVRALEDAARTPNEGGTAPHQLRMDLAVVAEHAPAVTEWHLLRALIQRRGDQLRLLQVHVESLKQRLEERLDIRCPDAHEAARTWCFADTSFFLEGEYFTKVPWHKALGLKPVVLVVIPAVMDELDDWRSNAQRKRQQSGRDRSSGRWTS